MVKADMNFDIITPSYNHSQYLRETIESVLAQKDPKVEVSYYIMDGGSTDGSPDLIRSYESKLTYWRSGQDAGQTAAIAEGFAMGTGEVVAWINSDDFYPAGVFRRVTEFLTAHPEVDGVYGDCLMVDEHSVPVGLGIHIPVTWEDLFETPYLINQESTFIRRRLYERVGGVDPSYWGAMDYDLWLRVFREGHIAYLPEILGVHRFLPNQKSSTSNRYIDEMKKAREEFAKRYSLPIPSWPFSKDGRERLITKWEQHWSAILRWVGKGCPEAELNGPVADFWQRYSQDGVLAVRGTTSFGWIGPEGLYVLDRQVIGPTLDWIFTSQTPGLSATSISLNLERTLSTINLNKDVSLTVNLKEEKRFSVLRITADRAFIPALENWGPAYFYLSLGSYPQPKGKQIVSVQSIPCLPNTDDLKARETDEINEVKGASSAAKSVKRRPLKVSYFTSHPASVASGSEILMYETAKALIARGHDARVYVMNARMDKDPPFFAKQIPTFPLEQLAEHVLRRLTGLNDLFSPSTALLRFQPWIASSDIWHFHNLHGHYLSIPVLGLLSWTKRVVISPVDQFLLTGHCPYPSGCEQYRDGCGLCPRLNDRWPGISRNTTDILWRIKRLFHRFSRVNLFFHTHALANSYQTVFANDPPYPVIPYGVDIHSYRPIPRLDCAHRLGVKLDSRFVAGFFHSHVSDPRKGIPSVIKKLGDLAKEIPERFELLVVGRGSEAVKDVVAPPLSATALPFLKHPYELANALNLCDVLLYPTQSENLSLTCLSALACGVPVISYDVGGQGEAVRDGVNGFLLPLNDEEGMAAALLKMMRDPDLRQRLSEGARRFAETFFDFDRYINDLIEYYYELM